MNQYRVIIPNLERREDRWYVCLGALLAQGVNPDLIERFPAHDGLNYESSDEARVAALSMFPDSAYLDCKWPHTLFYYCWSWTWYEIVSNIANEPDDAIPALVLVDDFMMRQTYHEIREHIRLVYKMDVPFKMIQYGGNFAENEKHPPKKDLPLINGTEDLRHGLIGCGDCATLISPIGARDVLESANRHPMDVPYHVIWWLAYKCDTAGYYVCDRTPYSINRNRHVNAFEDGRNCFPGGEKE